jgi:uncharacterized Tic20 family protein
VSFQSAAPGWYPDPERPDQQRYWDGSQWVGQPAPLAVQPTATNPRQWAMWAHLSALAGLLIGFNFVGPLIIYLVKKDEDPFVRDQAAEALNFNLSCFIYLAVSAIVTFVLILVIIGLFLLPFLAAIIIAWVVFVVIGAIRAGNGEVYRYPLTIRFVS